MARAGNHFEEYRGWSLSVVRHGRYGYSATVKPRDALAYDPRPATHVMDIRGEGAKERAIRRGRDMIDALLAEAAQVPFLRTSERLRGYAGFRGTQVRWVKMPENTWAVSGDLVNACFGGSLALYHHARQVLARYRRWCESSIEEERQS